LSSIARDGAALLQSLDPYGSHVAKPEGSAHGQAGAADPFTVVVGSAGPAKVCVAKNVDPDRLKFDSVPTFDPKSVYDSETYAAFADPSILRKSDDAIELVSREMPNVKVKGTRSDQLRLYKKLDDHGRLAIFSTEEIGSRPRSGLFAVAKNHVKDRLVLDARPPNLQEVSICRWTKFMATIVPLLGLYIPYNQIAMLYSEDLVDYYYEFKTSVSRTMRNVLHGNWSPMAFLDFRCFRKALLASKSVAVCLNTMAMGDLNAVEFGQAGHLIPALKCGVLKAHELIFLNSRPPRGPFCGGIIQDDIGFIEFELAKSENNKLVPFPICPHASVAQVRADIMKSEYLRLGLVRNLEKSVVRSPSSTLWGGKFDGVKGELRAPPPRIAALSILTFRLLVLGLGTSEILEIMSGSYISAYLFRRPMMSLLTYVFRARRGKAHYDLLRFSKCLKRELLINCVLVPLAATNLRADGCSEIFCVDASSHTIAAVSSPAPSFVTRELCRHSLRKGGWSKLLSPSSALEHSYDRLDPEFTVPVQELPQPSSVCEDAATFLKYDLVWAHPYPSSVHINVGELQAALRTVKTVASTQRSVRVPIIGDSLVAGFCLTKGRSSSAQLNFEIVSTLPTILGGDIYASMLWCRSPFNPSDDPTRHVPLREPPGPPPQWLSDLFKGEFSTLDLLVSREDLLSCPHLNALHQFDKPCFLASASSRKRVASRPTRGAPTVAADHASGCSDQPLCSVQHVLLDPLKCSMPSLLTVRDGEGPPSSIFQGHPIGSPVPALSVEARVVLSHFKVSLFLRRPADLRNPHWTPKVPGSLDLYSGSKRYAKRCLARGAPWVLCIDVKHDPNCDLLSPAFQDLILRAVSCGCFSNIGGGPPCSSFSQAVTPPCRSPVYPEGNPWASENMKQKMLIGNQHADFVVRLLSSLPSHMHFWIENPDGSWLFRMPHVVDFVNSHPIWNFRIDYCRFGTPYRKRTRFLTNIPLLCHVPILCDRTHVHTVLRGQHPSGVLWTQVAEPYPFPVADLLALCVCVASKWHPEVSSDLVLIAARACKDSRRKRVSAGHASKVCA